MRIFILLFVFLCSVFAHPDEVKNLPGWAGTEKMHAGYVTVDETAQRKLYYFLVESKGNPSTDPLVIWTNGGPGCSSLLGLFTEQGHFYIDPSDNKLTANPYTWSWSANMLYIEHPAGVGFTSTKNPADLITGDAKDAEDLYTFLMGFYDKFPEFVGRPLWISGESYAGHYVPNFAAKIVEKNLAGAPVQVNLVGLQIGNPWTHPEDDNTAAVEYWYSRHMISKRVRDGLIRTCNMSEAGPLLASKQVRLHTGEQITGLGFNPKRNPDGSEVRDHDDYSCNQYISQAKNQRGRTNIYNVYVDVCTPEQSEAIADEFAAMDFSKITPKPAVSEYELIERLRSGSNNNAGCATYYDPCSQDRLINYLNQPEVKKAINADPSITWDLCSNIVRYSREDLFSSMIPVYKYLFRYAPNLRILIFGGDNDAIVPVSGAILWMDRLNMTRVEEWRPYNVNKQVGGWVEVFDKMTIATVRNAGHEVPQYQQERSLYLFDKFLKDERL